MSSILQGSQASHNTLVFLLQSVIWYVNKISGSFSVSLLSGPINNICFMKFFRSVDLTYLCVFSFRYNSSRYIHGKQKNCETSAQLIM